MKRAMHVLTPVFGALTAAFAAATCFTGNGVFEALAITFGTFFYHLGMRLIVGWTIDVVKRNRWDYGAWWFRKRGFEDGFYKALKVKGWKVSIPTYSPENFDIRRLGAESVVMATCQAEVVHEVIIALSFLPIAAIPLFGEPIVFVLTSVAAALFDSVFVVLQRFNRPRLMRLIKK